MPCRSIPVVIAVLVITLPTGIGWGRPSNNDAEASKSEVAETAARTNFPPAAGKDKDGSIKAGQAASTAKSRHIAPSRLRTLFGSLGKRDSSPSPPSPWIKTGMSCSGPGVNAVLCHTEKSRGGPSTEQGCLQLAQQHHAMGVETTMLHGSRYCFLYFQTSVMCNTASLPGFYRAERISTSATTQGITPSPSKSAFAAGVCYYDPQYVVKVSLGTESAANDADWTAVEDGHSVLLDPGLASQLVQMNTELDHVAARNSSMERRMLSEDMDLDVVLREAYPLGLVPTMTSVTRHNRMVAAGLIQATKNLAGLTLSELDDLAGMPLHAKVLSSRDEEVDEDEADEDEEDEDEEDEDEEVSGSAGAAQGSSMLVAEEEMEGEPGLGKETWGRSLQAKGIGQEMDHWKQGKFIGNGITEHEYCFHEDVDLTRQGVFDTAIRQATAEINAEGECIRFKKAATCELRKDVNMMVMVSKPIGDDWDDCTFGVARRRRRGDYKGNMLNMKLGYCSTHYYLGTVIHELGHLFGLAHEHVRCDRDSYVEIAGGIQQKWSAFEKKEGVHISQARRRVPYHNYLLSPVCDQVTDYDYNSLMHYEAGNGVSEGFEMPVKKPDQCLRPNKKCIGRRSGGFSPTDVKQIRSIYNCQQKTAVRPSGSAGPGFFYHNLQVTNVDASGLSSSYLGKYIQQTTPQNGAPWFKKEGSNHYLYWTECTTTDHWDNSKDWGDRKDIGMWNFGTHICNSNCASCSPPPKFWAPGSYERPLTGPQEWAPHKKKDTFRVDVKPTDIMEHSWWPKDQRVCSSKYTAGNDVHGTPVSRRRNSFTSLTTAKAECAADNKCKALTDWNGMQAPAPGFYGEAYMCGYPITEVADARGRIYRKGKLVPATPPKSLYQYVKTADKICDGRYKPANPKTSYTLEEAKALCNADIKCAGLTDWAEPSLRGDILCKIGFTAYGKAKQTLYTKLYVGATQADGYDSRTLSWRIVPSPPPSPPPPRPSPPPPRPSPPPPRPSPPPPRPSPPPPRPSPPPPRPSPPPPSADEINFLGWNPEGNNGDSTGTPLGMCQGDCDNDAHCDTGLMCFMRRDGKVPGCSGDGGKHRDYCASEYIKHVGRSCDIGRQEYPGGSWSASTEQVAKYVCSQKADCGGVSRYDGGSKGWQLCRHPLGPALKVSDDADGLVYEKTHKWIEHGDKECPKKESWPDSSYNSRTEAAAKDKCSETPSCNAVTRFDSENAGWQLCTSPMSQLAIKAGGAVFEKQLVSGRCTPGQGPSGSSALSQSNDNSEDACRTKCQQSGSCEAFDYTSKPSSNSCRLYDKKPHEATYRFDGGSDNRQVCFMPYYGRCTPGQGPSGSPALSQSNDNSEAACRIKCQKQSGSCKAFDYTSKPSSNSCRLFDETQKQAYRTNGGNDNRQVCFMQT